MVIYILHLEILKIGEIIKRNRLPFRKPYSSFMKIYDINNNEYNLQEIEDTGWVQITDGIKARKRNEIVTLVFQVDISATSGAWVTLGTLPEQFTPNEVVFCILSVNTNNPQTQANIQITSYNEIRAIAGVTSQYIGSITYPV